MALLHIVSVCTCLNIAWYLLLSVCTVMLALLNYRSHKVCLKSHACESDVTNTAKYGDPYSEFVLCN